MHYDDARQFIADGDAILVRGKHGFLSPFTKFFTRSPYTHAGIALWMDNVLWLFETNAGGDHLVPLSQLAGCDFDVYARPEEVPENRVKGAVIMELRDKTKYGFLSLPVIGFINYFGIKVSLNWRRILSCAGMTVRVYEHAGYPETTYILSPADLARRLTMKFAVRVDDAVLSLAA